MKRFIPFLLVLVILTVFASVSQAATLDSRTISGTEFTLLSNTSQCLSNCEAIIEWDLTKGILTDVQLPAEKTSEFSFKIVKKTEQTKDLTDFGIEVWEEIGTEIQDYRLEEEIYEIDLAELQGLDANAQSLVCEDYGCTEKEKGICNCTRIINVENGSHTEYNWEKIANDFYGFKAIKGKVYRLRVWGNKKAEIGSDGVDWIPTFFGQEITEWAWWENAWKLKQKVTVNTSDILTGDITNDHVILVDINSANASFWDNVDSTGKDVRFVNSAEDTEYDYHFEKFDYGNEIMIAWVEVTDTFTSASDLEFYTYYGNSSATDAQDEEGTYPASYTAVFHQEDDASPQHDSTSNGFDLTHYNNPTLEADGKIGNAIEYNAATDYSLNDTLMDTAVTKYSVSVWVMKDAGWTDSDPEGGKIIDKHNNAADDWWYFQFTTAGKLKYSGNANGGGLLGIFSNRTVWNAGEWYHLLAVVDTVADTIEFYINADNADGGSSSGMGWAGGWQAGTHRDFEISGSDSGTETVEAHVDEVKIFHGVALTDDEVKLIYNSESSSLLSFGEEENEIIDFNISGINGLSFTTHPIISYGFDGDVTIDFNVFLPDNIRLTIDLNYGPPIQGTGTVIIKDLNLDSTICPDQDWNDEPSTCSYYWNYSTVSDGNYRIGGLINTGIVTSYDISDANFEIVNDVNLQINIPIDETTGEQIDISKYSYIVKILNDAEQIHKNNTDTNFFTIPLSEKIIVLIDTNVDAAYWGREYAFFYDTPASKDILQPYLAPVDSSILTTIHTVSNVTLTAIPNMRIKVFKNLEEGRTLINDSITDGKGETAVAFVIADNYEIEVWTDSELLFSENYVATSTTNEHFIYLPEEGIVEAPIILNASVRYLPALRERTNTDFNISIIVASNNNAITAVRINLINNGIIIYDTGIDNLIASDGNTYIINVNDLPGLNTAFTIDANVVVWLSDGSIIVSKDSWSFAFIGAEEDSMMWLLTNGMRKDFGCSYGTDQLLGTTCQPLFLIAIFIIFFAIAGIALGSINNPTALAILSIIFTTFFIYITWIPFVWGVLMVVTGIVIIIAKSKVGI